jgi:NAD+--asparagine ADP-ribosyltransferase
MMNDTTSNDAISMEARVTKVGEAISEGVQSATAATAAVAGHAQKIVSDATAATTAAASQATKVLGDASETAQRAWAQAGAMAEDVLDAGRCATSSVSRQIHRHPLTAVMAGFALGYLAAMWIRRGGGRPQRETGDKTGAKALSP